MSENAHILVIDDEKNYLLVLQTLLEDAGYTVTAINDPVTALTFLQESEVDVVVTDMKMPHVSGVEILMQVKKQLPHIPVLIMTAFGTIESAVETMKYGAFDYITKPFSNDELLLSIHNAVELSHAHRQYRLLQEAMQEGNASCPICMETVKHPTKLPCDHVFCETCIAQWLETNQTCPVCRSKLNRSGDWIHGNGSRSNVFLFIWSV